MLTRDYIIIAGNIGTGKTIVAGLLGTLLPGCSTFLETCATFLKQFYADPSRFAFLNQLDYSLQFLEQAASIARCNTAVVQDRSIYDTHEVFTRLRLLEGLISHEEFQLLARIHAVADKLACPTLLVLLDASVDTTLERVRQRGLREEVGVSKTYLADLKNAYAQWYQQFNRCRKIAINTDEFTPEATADIILRALPE